MWSRKRIDIAWSDLTAGLFGVVFRQDADFYQRAIEQAWPVGDRSVFSCLSVRSGWDLLLGALNLPAGSEVLMSAMTIPDMDAIVRAHGLVPVPLDLTPQTAVPTAETLRRAISPQSKAVLIAHLFGTRAELDPLIDTARDHGLLFVEDCAQAYAGPHFAGHPRADVSMFSFGTIKTCTALGGGVFHLRDANLCDTMKTRQAAYPVQSRATYFRRLMKYSGLKLLSTYVAFGLFTRCCRLAGIDPNALLNRSVRGFAGQGVERFRQRPSAALLALLARRFQLYHSQRIERQRALGDRLFSRIQPVANCPGSGAGYHHYWVFPVLADQPRELIQTLHRAGFDATQGESMHIIERPAGSLAVEPVIAQDLLSRLVYVPMYPELTERALDRLADVLLRYFEKHPPSPSPVPAEAVKELEEVKER